MRRRTLLLLFVLLGGNAALEADEIVLRDGDRLRGSVFGQGDERRVNPYGSTAPEMTFGAMQVRARDILEVLPDPTRSGFFRQHDALAGRDIQGRVDLMRWAQRHRLRPEIARVTAEILALQPSHAEAKKAHKGSDLAKVPMVDRLPGLDGAFRGTLRRIVREDTGAARMRLAGEASKRFGLEVGPAWVERMVRSRQLARGLQTQRTLAYRGEEFPEARYDLFVPQNYDAMRPTPLILAFHGGGILGTKKDGPVLGTGRDATALFLESAKQAGWLLVSPNALAAPWSDKKNLEMVDAVLEEILRTWNVDLNRIHLVGHSGGAEGAYAYAVRHDERFASVGGAAGIAPRKARTIAKNGAGPWLYHGEDDDILPLAPVRKAAEKLLKAKADFRYCELPREGHGFPPAAMADWLDFARHRRRLKSRSAWPQSSFTLVPDDAEVAAFGNPAGAWGGAWVEQGAVPELVAAVRAGRYEAEPAARRLASLGSALTEATRQALRDVVENREGPRDARAWSAWVLGQLRDKDDGTIMVLGDALRAEKDLILLRFLAEAVGRVASPDNVEDLRFALLQARVHFLGLKGQTVAYGDYERVIRLVSVLVESLGRTAKAKDVQRDIEEVCIIAILRDRRRVTADIRLGEDVVGLRARLARSLGRAYKALGVDATVIQMLQVTTQRNPRLRDAARQGLREGLR